MRGTNWIDQFPAFQALPPDARETLATHCAIVTLAAGHRVYGPGQSPQNFLLLLEGAIRVQQVSESGREIVLYRLAAGESCALTTSCLLGDEDYAAEAITETPVRAVVMPRATFDDMVARSPVFRRFVFATFSTRFTDLFRLIDQVAFGSLDIRLAQKLLELSHGTQTVAATQQQLASELGTAREVVSRLLSEFHRRGWIATTRGSLALLDRKAIERLSREH